MKHLGAMAKSRRRFALVGKGNAIWPGSQVVRQRSAKLLYVGSIPIQASNRVRFRAQREISVSVARLIFPLAPHK